MSKVHWIMGHVIEFEKYDVVNNFKIILNDIGMIRLP